MVYTLVENASENRLCVARESKVDYLVQIHQKRLSFSTEKRSSYSTYSTLNECYSSTVVMYQALY